MLTTLNKNLVFENYQILCQSVGVPYDMLCVREVKIEAKIIFSSCIIVSSKMISSPYTNESQRLLYFCDYCGSNVIQVIIVR